MQTKTVTVTTKDGPMRSYLALPQNQKNALALALAVVVLQEAFGVNKHIQDVCHRLAEEGFIAIAPQIFHRSGDDLVFGYDEFPKLRPIFSTLTNESLEMDIVACVRYLHETHQIPAKQTAVMGFCVGGFAAFLAACRLSEIGSVVSMYGGGIVHERPGVALKPLIGEASQIRMPVLCLFGGQDHNIPTSDVDAIRAELAKQPKLGHEVLVYPDADHGFLCEDRPSYHPASAFAAWVKSIAWLRDNLQGNRK